MNVARYWLIGQPVRHSLSPALHNAAFTALGIAERYEARAVAPGRVAEVLEELREVGAHGVNVTIPHKAEAARACADLDGDAQATGVVNTVRFHDDVAHGYNTDVAGAVAALGVLPIAVEAPRVALLGTGGSAAALRTALQRWRPGAAITQVGRQASGPVRSYQELDREAPKFDLVVNATPVGMPGGPGAFPVDVVAWIAADGVVFDLVYDGNGPGCFAAAALARGHFAADGRRMLAEQAVAAWVHWRGREDAERAREPMLAACSL